MNDLGDRGASELHGVIKAWIACATEPSVCQVIVFKIDATDEGELRIDHNDFAMLAPEPSKVKRLKREWLALWAIDSALRAYLMQGRQNPLLVSCAAKAIKHDADAHAAKRRKF